MDRRDERAGSSIATLVNFGSQALIGAGNRRSSNGSRPMETSTRPYLEPTGGVNQSFGRGLLHDSILRNRGVNGTFVPRAGGLQDCRER